MSKAQAIYWFSLAVAGGSAWPEARSRLLRRPARRLVAGSRPYPGLHSPSGPGCHWRRGDRRGRSRGGCGSNGGTSKREISRALRRGRRGDSRASGTGRRPHPGHVRLRQGSGPCLFLVIDNQGRSIERPTARVWVARRSDEQTLPRTTARSENIGVPGVPPRGRGRRLEDLRCRFRARRPGST